MASKKTDGEQRVSQVGFAPQVAGLRLCLDFVNTEGIVRNNPPDRLDTFELFAEWALQHGLGEVPPPDDVEAFLDRARELREALYRIFTAVTQGVEPPADDLSRLNLELGEALTRLRLATGTGGLEWSLRREGERTEEVLDPVVLSASALLTSERLGRVKECASDTCSWMFIDESRNRSRRWCDMADCGNRAKARRFYHRHASTDSAD